MTPAASTAPDSPLPSRRAQQDVALVTAALGGSQAAYADLLQRYHKSLFNVVWKMVRDPVEAEDLTIETFSKAFRNLGRYTPHYAFSTWLYRIATNHCIDYIRRQKLPTLSLSEKLGTSEDAGSLLEVRAPDLDPQEIVMRQQRREVVQHAVAQLPSKYRHLVELRYFQEWSYEEIAIELQAPLGTVKAQLFRARELLFDYLNVQHSAL